MAKGAKRKRYAFSAVYLLAAAVIAAFLFHTFVTGDREVRPGVSRLDATDGVETEKPPAGNELLTVLTLNVSHGSRTGPSPVFHDPGSISSNLDAVAAVLGREGPAVAALQEADGPSKWSGDFDHIEYLAEKAGFPYSIRGEHVKGMGLSYGTALLSKLPLDDALSVTFKPSPPTFTKGFVVAAVEWPGRPDSSVDVVSLHLDFSRSAVRMRQVEEFVVYAGKRSRPLIVLGDFNCEWEDDESAVRLLVHQLGLEVYQPDSASLETYPFLKRRLDWILVSPEFEFESYRVVPDAVSDHRAVVARIRMVGRGK